MGVESYVPKQEQFQSGERECNREIMGKLGCGQFMGEQSSSSPSPTPTGNSELPKISSDLKKNEILEILTWPGYAGVIDYMKTNELGRRCSEPQV